jgi:hypothetical protein
VTSLFLPLLLVMFRTIRSSEEKGYERLSTPDATKCVCMPFHLVYHDTQRAQIYIFRHVFADNHAADRRFHHRIGAQQDKYRSRAHHSCPQPGGQTAQYGFACIHGRSMLRKYVDKVCLATFFTVSHSSYREVTSLLQHYASL